MTDSIVAHTDTDGLPRSIAEIKALIDQLTATQEALAIFMERRDFWYAECSYQKSLRRTHEQAQTEQISRLEAERDLAQAELGYYISLATDNEGSASLLYLSLRLRAKAERERDLLKKMLRDATVDHDALLAERDRWQQEAAERMTEATARLRDESEAK